MWGEFLFSVLNYVMLKYVSEGIKSALIINYIYSLMPSEIHGPVSSKSPLLGRNELVPVMRRAGSSL